jgi:aminoglycoside phosphotransferase (APT) family kinase protein
MSSSRGCRGGLWARRSSPTSSAGCPGSLRGCPCPSPIRNGPGFPAGAAAAVGGFLGALHVPAPADAPANPFRGVPLARRAGTFTASLALLTGQAGQDQADWDAVLRGQDAALAAPRYDGPPVWLHGDLHPANILVNNGQVSGVIDFGDITAGDPARMLLPLDWHPSFWSAYQAAGGQVDDPLRVRARGWALNLAIVFLAHSEDNPVLREVGRGTLRTVLANQRGPAG